MSVPTKTFTPKEPKRLLLRTLSVVFFGLALGFCIPPVPSDPDTRYKFFPVGIAALGLLAASRSIDRRWGVSWWQIIVEILLIAVLGVTTFERALIR
jgi:hypothetical protein